MVTSTDVTGQVDTGFLQAFADAWNRHDIDAMMSFMADDCVFELSSGPDVNGKRFEGTEQVRACYQAVLDAFPDGRWNATTHFVNGDRGVSQWVFTGTSADGSRVEVNGCDLFAFRDGKIAVKDSYRKNRTMG